MTASAPTQRRTRRLVGIVEAAAVAVVAAFAWTSNRYDIAFGIFSGDSSRRVVDRWYAGLLSDIGIVLWALAAGVLVFVAVRAGIDASTRARVTAVAVTLAWLGADDLFVLHEEVIPERFGIAEPVVLGTEAVVIAVMIAATAPLWRRVAPRVFIGAWAVLAASLVIARLPLGPLASTAVASCCKFVGIANLFLFAVLTASAEAGAQNRSG